MPVSAEFPVEHQAWGASAYLAHFIGYPDGIVDFHRGMSAPSRDHSFSCSEVAGIVPFVVGVGYRGCGWADFEMENFSRCSNIHFMVKCIYHFGVSASLPDCGHPPGVIMLQTFSEHSPMSLQDRDRRVVARIGTLRFAPWGITGGSGSYIPQQDEVRRPVVDMSGSGGAASRGYSHPYLTEAVRAAAGNKAGVSLLTYPNESAVQLAEALVARTPGTADSRVWFGYSGSDANDCVVRTLLHAAVTCGESRRTRFVSFVGSYHGNLSASMGGSGHTAMTHSLPRAGLVLLPYPDQYRQRFSPDEVLRLLDYYFATTCPPDQVAGVFMEPILSDGGCPTAGLSQGDSGSLPASRSPDCPG